MCLPINVLDDCNVRVLRAKPPDQIVHFGAFASENGNISFSIADVRMMDWWIDLTYDTEFQSLKMIFAGVKAYPHILLPPSLCLSVYLSV